MDAEKHNIPESEKVAGGLDKEAVEIKEQDFIDAVKSVIQKEQDNTLEM